MFSKIHEVLEVFPVYSLGVPHPYTARLEMDGFKDMAVETLNRTHPAEPETKGHEKL